MNRWYISIYRTSISKVTPDTIFDTKIGIGDAVSHAIFCHLIATPNGTIGFMV